MEKDIPRLFLMMQWIFCKAGRSDGSRRRSGNYTGISGGLARALTLGKPIVIDCQIDKDEKVWPMVAPGAPIRSL